MTKGDAIPTVLAHRYSDVEPSHLGAYPGLVEEDQTVGVDERLSGIPDPALLGHIRAVLLSRPQVFLKGILSRVTSLLYSEIRRASP